MPSMYEPLIPTGLVNLDVDYQNIQDNFQQLDTSFGFDHVPFSDQTANNGYHKVVHMVPDSVIVGPGTNYPPTPPPPLGLIGELYTTQSNDGFSPDEILWYQSGGARVIQLTRNFTPLIASNGYTFLPGGLVLQWGLINGTHGGDNHFNGGDSGTVTFATANIAFPANCFTVWTQEAYTTGNEPSSSGSGNFAVDRTFSNLSFNWFVATNSSKYTRFYWFALGN